MVRLLKMKMQVKLILSLLMLISEYPLHVSSYLDELNKNVSLLLDSVIKDYDKRLPPNYGKDQDQRCIPIYINILITSMSSLSEVDMDYSMTLFIRERWQDPRLAFNTTMDITRLEMDASFMTKVWKPDVYIFNEKFAEVHTVTVKNQMVHLYPNGTVQTSMRATGSFTCSMDLMNYPFDVQECYMELESFAHSSDQLLYKWTENPVTVAKGITFPQFTLTETQQYVCDRQYYGIEFPCVGVKFILQRQYSYYIIQIYVPSCLIVVLSWVSFWLDADAVPARISLGLLTVLTMETQSSSARANLPPVSSIKAIDVWMAVCLTFVFLALVEFAYVNVQSRVQHRRQLQNTKDINEDMLLSHDTKENLKEVVKIDRKPCSFFKKLSGLERARFVDKVSRVAFPLTFILFNVAYWIFYFKWKPDMLRVKP